MVTEMSQLIDSLESRPYRVPQRESDSGRLLLARGIAALQASDAGKARQFLTQALQQNAESEEAWFWLSAAI
jgi:Tfp pilus assembly protein PilF